MSLVSILLSLVILCKLSAVAGQRTSRAAATVPARTSTEAREPTRGSTTTANWRTRGGDEATRGPTTSFVRGTAPPLATRVTTTSAFRTRNPGATTTTGRRGGGGGDSGNTVRTRAPLTTTRQPGITRPADASAVTRPAGDPSDSRSGTGAVRGTTSEAAARVYSSHNGRDGRTTPLVTRPSTASAGDLGGGGSSDRTPSVAVVVEVPSSTTAGAEWGVETRGQPQGEVREGTETMLPRSTPLLPAVERTTEAMAGTRYFIGMSSDSGRAPIEETQPRPGSSATVSLSSEELFRRDLTMPAVTRTSQSDPVTRAGPPSVPGSRPTQEHGGTDHRGPAVSDRSMSPALDVTRYQTEPVGTRETVTVADVTRAVGWTLFHDRTPRTVDLRTESISRSPTATAALTGQSQSVSASTHRATPDAPVSEDKFSRTSPAVSITGHSSSLFTSRRVEESTGTVGVSTHSGFDTSTELPQVRTSVHSPTAAVTAFPTHWVTESTASSGKPSTAVATSASTRWSVESPAPTTTPIDSYSHSTSAAIQVSHATSDEGSAFDSTATSISGSMPMTTIDVSSAPTKTTSQLPVVTITSGQVGQTSPQTEGGSCQGVCSSGTNRVANGKCNNGNNNCGCGWDGGDCCLPSVTPDQFSNCGGSPELCCLDPTGVSSVLTTAAVEATTDTCTRLACVLLSFIHLHSLFTQHSPLLLHLERNGLFVDQILVSSAGLETGPLASVQDTVALALVIDGYTLETLDATVQAQLTAGLVAYFDDEVFQGLAVVHDDDVAIVAVSVAARRLLLRVPAGLGRGLQEQSVQVDVHISLPIMTVSEFIASQGTPVASTLGQQASTSTAEPSNSTGSQQGFVVVRVERMMGMVCCIAAVQQILSDCYPLLLLVKELSREEVIAIASVGAAIILLTILALGIALCCR